MSRYDSINSYEDAFKIVKDLIIETIVEMANPEDVKISGLTNEIYANIIFVHIVALGINNENLYSAFDTLFPLRDPRFYKETDENDAAVKMMINLAGINKEYQQQVWAFKGFHQNTNKSMPFKNVIIEVKKHLLAAQLGF